MNMSPQQLGLCFGAVIALILLHQAVVESEPLRKPQATVSSLEERISHLETRLLHRDPGPSEPVRVFSVPIQEDRVTTNGYRPPLKCRGDLAALATKLELTTVAAEIGVRDGRFARHNLALWPGRMYYMVDAWGHRPGTVEVGLQDKTLQDNNEADEAPHLQRMELAKDNTARWSDRRTMIRGFSTTVHSQFTEEYFDWIYIDALHTYEAVRQDLAAWWPKLRPGGLISGDDFVDFDDTEMVAWNGPTPSLFSWGVRAAVTEFFRELGVPMRVTYMYDCYMHPAWYVLKPDNGPSKNEQRLAATRSHPVKCRDDLLVLATELAVNKASGQVGELLVLDNDNLVVGPPLVETQVSQSTVADDATWSWLHITSQADHTRATVLAQLSFWWPKLRPGGLMSGDDFVSGRDIRWTATEDNDYHYVAPGWQATSKVRQTTPSEWDVEAAVNEFFADRNVEVFVSYALYCYPYPSWYVVKP